MTLPVNIAMIWHLSRVLTARDMQAALYMGMDSFKSMPGHKDLDMRRHDRFVIFVPGFSAHFSLYRRLAQYVHARHIQLLCPLGDVRNTCGFDETCEKIFDCAIMIRKRTGYIPPLWGHSLGGLQVLMTLPELPATKEVTLIAAPIAGVALEQIGQYIRKQNKHATMFNKDVLADASVLSRVITFETVRDKVVPPSNGTLTGVKKNILIPPSTPTSAWNTHTGLWYFMRRELLASAPSLTNRQNRSKQGHS